jgi:hypothetical protein
MFRAKPQEGRRFIPADGMVSNNRPALLKSMTDFNHVMIKVKQLES